LETDTGKTLWHAGSGARIGSSPITYELDGRQYLLVSGGSVLFAWALPDSAATTSRENNLQHGPALARK
jgi:alcohol dehydrogenase (cytochrome c)